MGPTAPTVDDPEKPERLATEPDPSHIPPRHPGGSGRPSTRSTRARSPIRTATASGTCGHPQPTSSDLVWLGVDALWLSPFYRSPMVDFGYDVSDHCDVDPVFGTIDDFDRLLADAHDARPQGDHRLGAEPHVRPASLVRRRALGPVERGTGTGTSGGTARPDGRPPNNWVSAFDLSAPAWTLRRGDRVSGTSTSSNPASRISTGTSPKSSRRCTTSLRFWLDRGVDGFRADAIPCIGKDPALPDDPEGRVGIPHCVFNDEPVTHGASARSGSWSTPTATGSWSARSSSSRPRRSRTYYGSGDELHLAFNFPPLFATWKADAWSECLAQDLAGARPARRMADLGPLQPRQPPPSDPLRLRRRARRRGRRGADAAAARHGRRAAAVLLLTLRGTHPSSTRGRSSACWTPRSPTIGWSTQAAVTAAARRFPGTARTDHGWPTAAGLASVAALPAGPGERNYRDLRRRPRLDPPPLPPAARAPSPDAGPRLR